ncbi:MAG: hypothetical protein K2Q34_02400 [Alphaproteobacteria bacterium]|nr:hypothetical protein [Alphaproteobacteria bacterium]
MKIIQTGRLILYVLLLALSFQKAQAMEGESKPLHRGVRVIGKADTNSADDIKTLVSLCDVIATGKGTVNDNGRVTHFKGLDYNHKITAEEREILYRPLIDVSIRLKRAGNEEALAKVFRAYIRNLNGSYAAWQKVSLADNVNERKLFYHHLTALAVSALAIDDFEKLTLSDDVQKLFAEKKEKVRTSASFKRALESVTGLNGEIRQVKAYIKKQPESHLVLGVRNNEDRLERFDSNWVFLNNEPHDPNKGRCLTVDFNDLSQLEKIAFGLPGLFNSIVTDASVFKFTQWDQRHLTYFKSMLKKGGEFIFIPGDTQRAADIVVSDIDSCLTHLSDIVKTPLSTIEEHLSCLLYFNRKPDFTPLNEGRPQRLNYHYQTFEGDSETLRSFIKLKKEQYKKYKDNAPTSFYTPDIIDFINGHKLETESLWKQTWELALWISEEFFRRYTVLWYMPILGSVFDKVLYMRDEGYCDYKPYPFDIGNSSPLYIRCINNIVP